MIKKNLTIVILLSLIISCSKDEDSPVEPAKVGSVEGVVTFFSTNSALENVNIFTTPPTGYVSSDAAGSYSIFNVEPGEYKITAAKEGYDTLDADIMVSAGAVTTANFILENYDSLNSQSYGLVTGTVKNSITEAQLKGVSIITVPPTSSVTSNVAGYFSIYNVKPGQYLVKAKKVGYDSTQITVTVTSGTTVFADISMMPADTSGADVGTISGYAIDSQSGLYLNGVQVSVVPPVSSVLTNSEGFYRIQNVAPGEYKVNAAKSGYTIFSVDVTVSAGSNTSADLLMVSATGIASGTVTSAVTGMPISGVQVKTTPGTSVVATDQLGKYNINNIAPGSLTIIAQKTGYIPDTLSVNILANVTTKADFILNSQ